MAAREGRSVLARSATVALVRMLFDVLAGSSVVAEAWRPEPDVGVAGSGVVPPAAIGPPGATGPVGVDGVPPALVPPSLPGAGATTGGRGTETTGPGSAGGGSTGTGSGGGGSAGGS